jgi:hypothetical protein
MTVKTPIHIHYDVEMSAYRLGQIFDEMDHEAVQGCIFVFTAECSTIYDSTSHSPDIAPSFQTVKSPNGVELDAILPISNVPSSASKSEKVPKPRNMWIIYRQHKHNAVLARNPGMHTSEICECTQMSVFMN